MKIELFYDKECPFCKSYSKYLKIKQMHNLVLLNVREHKNHVEDLKIKGFDLNDGFIIRIDNTTIYQGVDAIIILNELSENKLYFPDNTFFRDIVYPIIKQFRIGVLFIMGKNSDL
jgi:predicted DCC family thiol-disulfide oxidoreductase YuxK